jgi:hypothetical protein
LPGLSRRISVRLKSAVVVVACFALVLASAAFAGKTIKKTYKLTDTANSTSYSLEIDMKGKKKSSLSPKAVKNFTATGIPYTCADQQTGTIDLDVKGPFKLSNFGTTSPPDKTFTASGSDANGYGYTLDNSIIESSGKLASGDVNVEDFPMPSTVSPPTTNCVAMNFLTYSAAK